MVTTIRQLLTDKGDQVFSVGPESTVFEAIRKMADENVGCLVVCEAEKPVGIITERHYARNVVLRGRGSPTTKVSEIMDTDVLYARPDQTVEECMAVMTDKRVRHLPVIAEGKLAGIVSIGDLVKAKISDQQFIIDQLVQYMHG